MFADGLSETMGWCDRAQLGAPQGSDLQSLGASEGDARLPASPALDRLIHERA